MHAVASEFAEDDVKLTAVLNERATLMPAELFEWAKDRVPYFALPRYIDSGAETPSRSGARAITRCVATDSATRHA